MRKHVLIVAGDAATRAAVARVLQPAGYSVELAAGEKRARELVAAGGIDAAVVAPASLGAHGQVLIDDLRGIIARVIVLADQADHIGRHGQSDGDVQEALPFPLEPKELLDRLRKLFKPPEEADDKAATDILRFEGCTLDLAGRTLRDAGDREVPLTHAEFELLATFVRRPGRVLSRDRLRQAIAGRGNEPFERSIDMLVGRLRRKIEPDPKAPRLVITVPGEGYRFAGRPQPIKTATPNGDPGEGAPDAVAQPISNLPYPSIGTLFRGRDTFLLQLRESLTREGGGRTAIVRRSTASGVSARPGWRSNTPTPTA